MATWRLTTYDRVMSVVRGDARAVLDVIATANRFVVQQVFKPIANEYRISAPAAGTDEGEPLLFVRQKRMKIREDIRFRLRPDDDAHLFMIKSKSVFEFRGRHEALDASWVIALLRRFADFGPDFLSLLEWLPFNFVFMREGAELGRYRRVLG